jgi:hypothetical protein
MINLGTVNRLLSEDPKKFERDMVALFNINYHCTILRRSGVVVDVETGELLDE